MTTRETVHALLDRVPDDRLEPIARLLACQATDGTDISAKAILDRLGHKRATLAEFEAEYGPVGAPDGEG